MPLHHRSASPDPADEAHVAVLGAAGVRLDPVRVRLSGPLAVDPIEVDAALAEVGLLGGNSIG